MIQENRKEMIMIDMEKLVRALQKELPNMIQREEDARSAVRAVFSTIAGGLCDLESVRMEGIGELTVNHDATPPSVEFKPDKGLQEALAAHSKNESMD